MQSGQRAAAQRVESGATWEKWVMCLNFIQPGKVCSDLLVAAGYFHGSSWGISALFNSILIKGFSCSYCGNLSCTWTENCIKGNRSDEACGGEEEQSEQRWWTDTRRDRGKERRPFLEWFFSPQQPDLLWLVWSWLSWGLTKQVDTSLLFPPVSERRKWMWPRDQHAAILAKNQYFFPLSCIASLSCNISIHMCAQSTLILHVCVCARVCVQQGKRKMFHWTKAAQPVWTAPLKQSLFLIRRRRKGASWLNTGWMSV